MAASVKIILRESKARSDGTCPVWIRITANRKSRFISTGIYVSAKQWNAPRQQVRKSHPLASAFNDKLRDLSLRAQKKVLDGRSPTAVKTGLDGSGGSLTDYFETYIRSLDSQGRYWDRKKFAVTLGKLRGSLGQRVNWGDLTREAVTTFERYCREKRGNNPNTVRNELKRLRRVVRQAIKEGLLQPGDDPFLVYERPKAVDPNRRKLEFDEIQLLEGLALEAHSALALARDAFLFSFYGGGIRFGDLCRLQQRHLHGRRLRYEMMKTGRFIEVPLPDAATRIAERWQDQADGELLLPLIRELDLDDPVWLRRRITSCNVIVNRNLKIVCETAGVTSPETVSLHVARHSFADYARRKTGDLYAISKTLGHSSLQVTQAYLRSFDRDSVDRLARDLWE